jgi:site-specific recombinase XerD
MIGVTTAIVLDKRIPRQDGTYAVKLRVTYKRQQQYYPINEFLTEDEWEKTQKNNPRKGSKNKKLFFNEIENRALEIIKTIQPFSFASFKKRFNQDSETQKDLIAIMKDYIESLKNEKRIGTAKSYQDALNSFIEFLNSKNRKKLMVWDCDSEWLKSFENWMLEKGRSNSTIGIYLRSLRTIVNIAIEQGSMPKEEYPFGKRKYQIPSSKNIKKALKITDIKRIVNYVPATISQEKAKDFWIFSYLCNGLNVKDIARLKYKNIHGNNLSFLRAKTEHTTKQDQKEISVPINNEMLQIIKKWGVKTNNTESYIFRILNDNDTPEIQYRKIQNATKSLNKSMKKIGEALELPMKITTYTARHSFATVLKRSGAPIEFISESLGHKDLKTTENYLDSFEDDVKEAYQKKLLDF